MLIPVHLIVLNNGEKVFHRATALDLDDECGEKYYQTPLPKGK